MGTKAGGLGSTGRACAWWLVSAPVDFRCGADRLLVHVREVLGREPLDGSAYIFRNRRASRIKVLRVDAQGVWLSARRSSLIANTCAAPESPSRTRSCPSAPGRVTGAVRGAPSVRCHA